MNDNQGTANRYIDARYTTSGVWEFLDDDNGLRATYTPGRSRFGRVGQTKGFVGAFGRQFDRLGIIAVGSKTYDLAQSGLVDVETGVPLQPHGLRLPDGRALTAQVFNHSVARPFKAHLELTDPSGALVARFRWVESQHHRLGPMLLRIDLGDGIEPTTELTPILAGVTILFFRSLTSSDLAGAAIASV